jgi:cysteine/glycine-rich protein
MRHWCFPERFFTDSTKKLPFAFSPKKQAVRFLEYLFLACLSQLGNYASLEGVLYCRPHFEQLLKTTGSFDKSFDTKTGTEVVKKLPSDKQENKPPTKASLLFSGTQEKCIACNKTVYPIEKTSVEGLPYHKNCFKCVHGGCTISPSNYAALEGRLYCKHHYSQLFKEKGNYSQFNKTPALKPTGSNASAEV